MELQKALDLYRRLNTSYWEGRLPMDLRILAVPDNRKGYHLDGRSHLGIYVPSPAPGSLEINEAALQWPKYFLPSLLIHEMIHIAIGVRHRHGSKAWNEEVDRVSKLGALKEVL